MKPYKFGLILGRFQTFHIGHKQITDAAIKLCGKVGVFVGSAQESGTEKNPFTFEERKEMIEKVCRGKVDVYPIFDKGYGNNSKWGEYVIECVRENTGTTPDLFISGREERRVDWFDGIEGLCMAELYIPKAIDISASRLREYMLHRDFKSWSAYIPKELWGYFDSMAKKVSSSYNNKKTESI